MNKVKLNIEAELPDHIDWETFTDEISIVIQQMVSTEKYTMIVDLMEEN